MIAEIFKQQRYEAGYRRGYKEGYELSLEEGRRAGVQAVQKAWEDWNGRREAAQANGQPFTEPPPALDLARDGDFARNGC